MDGSTINLNPGLCSGIDLGVSAEIAVDIPAAPPFTPSTKRPVAADDRTAPLSLEQARLFAAAAGGDRAAIAQVWRDNRRWIAAVLVAHAPRQADIEDLLQEVAATLVSRCHHLRDTASLRGWLRVVAINTARMALRDTTIERRTLRQVATRSGGVHGAPEPRHDETRETLALLAELPAIYAEILLLQSAQGLSQRQIAELLDVPETTVETRLARARRMLRVLVVQQQTGVRADSERMVTL